MFNECPYLIKTRLNFTSNFFFRPKYPHKLNINARIYKLFYIRDLEAVQKIGSRVLSGVKTGGFASSFSKPDKNALLLVF